MDQSLQSLQGHCTEHWNKLTPSVMNSKTIDSFKKTLDDCVQSASHYQLQRSEYRSLLPYRFRSPPLCTPVPPAPPPRHQRLSTQLTHPLHQFCHKIFHFCKCCMHRLLLFSDLSQLSFSEYKSSHQYFFINLPWKCLTWPFKRFQVLSSAPYHITCLPYCLQYNSHPVILAVFLNTLLRASYGEESQHPCSATQQCLPRMVSHSWYTSTFPYVPSSFIRLRVLLCPRHLFMWISLKVSFPFPAFLS